ncbi:hypothetical protein ACIQVE_27685 [Pseudomonas sp. NPDC098747]|uniref:hypothetical protein n=1 Tax=Pseudomonas sp. NPDC098747 TaxID=3364487 RepID=UPI00383A357A
MNTSLTMLSRARLNFFLTALWSPLLLMLGFFSLGLWEGEFSSETHWVYLLWFGMPGLLLFALWASRAAKSRNEQQALRMVWWAPVKFILFYAVPWMLYGLCSLVIGPLDDSYMAYGWIMLVPHLLIAGYFCSGVTVALYRIFF